MKTQVITVPVNPSFSEGGFSFYDFVYENHLFLLDGLMKRIDHLGRDWSINKLTDFMDFSNSQTIKIEGCELIDNVRAAVDEVIAYVNEVEQVTTKGQITAHMFYACKDYPSFATHTDPDNLIIWCINGCKTMIVNDERIVIESGQALIMPADTPHRATNEFDSVMLSISRGIIDG